MRERMRHRERERERENERERERMCHLEESSNGIGSFKGGRSPLLFKMWYEIICDASI